MTNSPAPTTGAIEWCPSSSTLLVGAVLATVCGCFSYSTTTVEKGKPLDQAAISRIVIGQTTRSDVFALLGTPHSVFEGQVEFREDQGVGFDPHLFYSYKDNRYLSSIDGQHYAMLYRFGKASGTTVVLAPVVVTYRGADARINTDELLLLVDKTTNVVDDVAYRQDTQ